jgi:hypothetical protein
MINQIKVLVGTGIGGQREIMESLRNEGFQVKSAKNRQWSRDHYVFHNGIYVKRGEATPEGNPFGEGGNIRLREGFFLVSDRVYNVSNVIKAELGELRERERERERTDYQKIKQTIAKEGERHFPSTRIHVAPTGYFHGGKGHEHIDMYTLLLPKSKTLIIDTHFGKCAGGAQEYDEIAEAEQLKLIKYDGSQDRVWYPLNSLVLSRGNSDVVFVDTKAISLIKLLEHEGIKSVEVEMPQQTYPAGKINCQTNTCKQEENIEGLLEEF